MDTNLGIAALRVAKREMQLGAREVGGNNLGPFVEKYLLVCGLKPPQPWCTAFVSWCIRKASLKAALKPSASARGLLSVARRLGLMVSKPEPGNLVFWSRGNPVGPYGHVGFVEKCSKGVLQTIEGNRSSSVERFWHPITDPKILGFARIA